MFLRKLEDDELERIKKAKNIIKEQRQELQSQIKKQRKRIQAETKRLKGTIRNADMYQHLTALQDHLSDLANQINALPIVTGLPVIVKIGDASLCLNYEILKKFERSLEKSDLRWGQIKIEGKSLIIRYEKHGQEGALELYEPVTYRVDLLHGLPSFDLTE